MTNELQYSSRIDICWTRQSHRWDWRLEPLKHRTSVFCIFKLLGGHIYIYIQLIKCSLFSLSRIQDIPNDWEHANLRQLEEFLWSEYQCGSFRPEFPLDKPGTYKVWTPSALQVCNSVQLSSTAVCAVVWRQHSWTLVPEKTDGLTLLFIHACVAIGYHITGHLV